MLLSKDKLVHRFSVKKVSYFILISLTCTFLHVLFIDQKYSCTFAHMNPLSVLKQVYDHEVWDSGDVAHILWTLLGH